MKISQKTLLLVTALLILAACGKKAEEKVESEAPTPVLVETANRGAIDRAKPTLVDPRTGATPSFSKS